MNPLKLTAIGLAALGLAACGGAEDTNAPAAPETEMPMDMMSDDGMVHDMGDGVGHATGIIRSVGSEGDFLTIDHGPFAGDIAMGAMTMGFNIMGEVDLSGFAEGDEVAFMVKQGRDGSYRVMAICNTGTDGGDCLDGMMDH